MDVTVVTAASGNYETTLKSEMAKTDAPTLFQVNGPVGLAAWKDYCYDLTGSDIASHVLLGVDGFAPQPLSSDKHSAAAKPSAKSLLFISIDLLIISH